MSEQYILNPELEAIGRLFGAINNADLGDLTVSVEIIADNGEAVGAIRMTDSGLYGFVPAPAADPDPSRLRDYEIAVQDLTREKAALADALRLEVGATDAALCLQTIHRRGAGITPIDLMNALASAVPELAWAVIDEDSDGQLIIYTDMAVGADGTLTRF